MFERVLNLYMTYLTYHSRSLSISLNYIRSFRIILFFARSRCYGVYFHAAACFHFGSSPCLTDFWKAPEQHLRQGWDYTFHILACHVFVVPFVRNVFDISTWPAAAAAWSGNVWKRTSTWCRGQWHHQAFASCFRQGSPLSPPSALSALLRFHVWSGSSLWPSNSLLLEIWNNLNLFKLVATRPRVSYRVCSCWLYLQVIFSLFIVFVPLWAHQRRTTSHDMVIACSQCSPMLWEAATGSNGVHFCWCLNKEHGCSRPGMPLVWELKIHI